MTITKNINGYYVISDIVRGHLFTRVYAGYTKCEAIRLFKQDVKKVNS